MKYLIRREYVTTGYEYSMPLTKEVMHSLQEFINEHIEPAVVVTEEMAVKAFSHVYDLWDKNEVLNTECRYKNSNSALFPITIADAIAHYLLDFVWEAEPEEIYCDVDEAYNEVNDSKDFD